MTDATESASSAFMPEGGLFSSDNLAQKNTVCNVYLRPGKIPTRIGRGMDGDRIGFFLPVPASSWSGVVAFLYESRHNLIKARSFDTAQKAAEWLDLLIFRPTIDRSHIDFEAEVGAFDACCLTQKQGLESMRYWFWKKLKEFTSSHELETNDGWIKFSALPPVE